MPDLLLELGCEELPANFVANSFRALHEAIANRLQEAEVPFESGNPPIGTPRRLIVHFKNVADRQPDRSKEMRGPTIQAAFDSDGKPTRALEGFCRGQGVDPNDVRKEGEYVWVTKTIPGRPTAELLAEILPQSIRSLTFEKSMRWGAARMRFARPIRWILACFDGNAVEFEIEGVKSGLKSRGHRFEHPEEFEAKTYDELVDGLIARKVEPDPAEREKRIREGTVIIATGEPDIPPALLDENVYLTEWPTPIEGQFKEEYLNLPEPVLVTAMAKHEKMFPVRGRDGKLINRFVFVRNSGDDATVRAGTEWVLNARFNDAKFFFDEDHKYKLADFLEKTSGILFQEKLGTVRQRADRLAQIAAEVAKYTGASAEEIEFAREAGLYAKADLSSGLVSELASLQGVVGGEYAKREGFPPAICHALATHYDLSKNPLIQSVEQKTAVRLLIADQLDKLVGYLGLGLLPSGSSDPFGLRRAATLLIEAAWAWPEWMPSYADFLVPASLKSYAQQGHEFDSSAVQRAFSEVLQGRYDSLLESERPDLVEATKAWAVSPKDASVRLAGLKKLVGDRDFVQTATRPINILNAAKEKGQYDPLAAGAGWSENLNSPEGAELHALATDIKGQLADAALALNDAKIADLLPRLREPINKFFDAAMIMDSDPNVRAARLELVKQVSDALMFAGDFSKVVLEGG